MPATSASSSASTANSPVLHSTPPDEPRALVFSLDATSATKVRVTLDHTEVVLFNTWSTPSVPRKNGAWVSVLIEVMGDKDDKAVVNVTNSDPAQLTSAAIPAGKTNVADPQLLEAKW